MVHLFRDVGNVAHQLDGGGKRSAFDAALDPGRVSGPAVEVAELVFHIGGGQQRGLFGHRPIVPRVTGQIVVGVALLDDAGHLLVAQRNEPAALAGFWELPGGKVDPGETDETALVRECQEELGVTVTLIDRVGGDLPIGQHGTLRIWSGRIATGELRAIEHAELRWVGPDEIEALSWLPADRPLLPALHALLSNP
jgi:8-oxo-dGTP diphosphatase